jgi:WG containing repeat
LSWVTLAVVALCVGRVAGAPADVGDSSAPPGAGATMLFPILQQDRWGFIDSTGRIVIPPRFESTVAVELERRIGEHKSRGARPGLADLLLAPGVGPESTATLGVKERGKWCLVDRRGIVVGKLRFAEMLEFCGGLAPVRTWERWGFVGHSGLLAIPELFDEVGCFNGGVCVVNVLGKQGVIDPLGRYVVNPRFELIVADDSVFHDNRAVVGMNGKMGYVSRAGTVAVPAVFDYAFRFSEGLAAVVKGGSTGYVDTTGQLVIAPRFDSGAPFSGGMARVMLGDKYGYINRTGAFVAKPQFSEAEDFGTRDRVAVRRGPEVGNLDRSGRWRPALYEELLPIDDSLVVGKVEGRSGIVRRDTGKFVQQFPWEQVGSFSEGLAAVRNSRTRFGFIDAAGRLVIANRFNDVGHFRNGLCKVAAGDTLGYVNRSGTLVWFGRFTGLRK